MKKITIKKRGKLFKLSNGETIRTPRIIYKNEYDIPELLAIFRKLNLSDVSDYIIEEISDNEVPVKKGTPQKFSKLRSGSLSIDLNNKIEPR